MNSTKRAIKLQCAETKKTILSFWVVMVVVDILAYFLNMNFYNTSTGSGVSIGISQSGSMGTSLSSASVNIIAMIIFFIVYNYERYYKSFPIAISFSITRKDYFKSFIIDNFFITAVFAIIQGVLMKIDPIFVKAIGRDPLYDFMFFNTKADNLLFIIFSLFVLLLTFTSIWNLIAVLNYKFGAKIWFVYFGVMYISSISINVKNIMFFLGTIFNSRIDVYQFLKLGSTTFICYILAYTIIKRTNIKHKVG